MMHSQLFMWINSIISLWLWLQSKQTYLSSLISSILDDVTKYDVVFWLWRRSPTSPNVCLSVCVWSIWKYAFLHPSTISRMHAECSWMFQNECRVFENIPECMQNVPECMQNDPECIQITDLWACMQYQNVPEHSRMHTDLWACMQVHELACSYISLHAVT